MKDINFIISEFGINSGYIKYKKLGEGHINDGKNIF